MPEEEENKKRTKKLVVEETSTPEVITEAVLESEKESEGSEPVEGKEEPEVETETKEESSQESILIPKEEGIGPEEKTFEKPFKNFPTKEDKNSKVSIFWVILLALFIIASLVGGGILIFRAGVEKGKLETGGTSEVVTSPTPTPVAFPSAEVKREDLKVQVLNGTGQAGVAATAKEYLEGLGYKDVGTGNADTADFTQAVISIKDAKKAYLETLKGDLSEKYEVSASTKTLSSTSDFDAVVTVGTSTK